MQNMGKMLSGAMLCLLLFSVSSFAHERSEDDGSILLPAERKSMLAGSEKAQRYLTASKTWQAFVAKHGEWSVQWNEATRTPHRAFGKGVVIDGFESIHQGNIEAATRAFLRDNAMALKASDDDLSLVRAQKIRNKWYVSYRQQYEGLDVLFSEVEFRLHENGKLMAFGVDYYHAIEVYPKPTLSYDDAKVKAVKNLRYNPAQDKTTGDDQLYILPVRHPNSLSHHLVYKVDVSVASPPGEFMTFVDAHTGEIHWRMNQVRTIDSKVQVDGDVHPIYPDDPYDSVAFNNLYVTVGGVQYETDELGSVIADLAAGPVAVDIELSGPWARVVNANGANASISTTLNAGDSVFVDWNDSNSLADERDVFYHTNLVHNFLNAIDPSSSAMDFQMLCTVNIGSEDPLWPCNAYYNGGINFFNAGGGCANTGQMPSVIYHEYGHGVNNIIYQAAGAPFGMINGATHEGVADIISTMIEDSPELGRGFFGGTGPLRNLDNDRRYPEDASASSHSTGLIIGGTFWDVRQNTSLELANELFHFARYGTPDDADAGIAFSEWFIEVLVVDDDDGDLSNGTPNFTAINNAFNDHGIGSGLYLGMSFAHTPLDHTDDTVNGYEVVFDLAGFEVNGQGIGSPTVVYSTDGLVTTTDLTATETTTGTFSALIPAQPAGTIVNYYITAVDEHSGEEARFPNSGSNTFLVGYITEVEDQMEIETGWVIGADDDDATTGAWERSNPQATSIGSQPEDDHTPGTGTLCFVTGPLAGTGAGTWDIDNGKTTLFSPIYDMSTYNSPAVEYWKWYSNNLGQAPSSDFWVVSISSDSGATWVDVENTLESTDGWERVIFFVEDYVDLTSTVQLRFVASDENAGSLVEALVDDFAILNAGVVTGIEDGNDGENSLPSSFSLAQNHPNPFNPTTEIAFDVADNAQISISIFNMLGQRVRSLVNEHRAPGQYTVTWDGRDDSGNGLSSGIYFYRMDALPLNGGSAPFSASNKMILLK